MNAAAKLIQRMHANPRDWALADLQSVAKRHGLTWRHEGGSHCIFIRADGKTLPVPARRPIKPVYVLKFLALLTAPPKESADDETA